MKKVSYEEVNKYLDVVYGEDDYYCSTDDFEDRATMFDNAVKGIDNFIEQHKPPTWEDVVNAWQFYDPMYDRIELNESGIVVIYYDSESPLVGPYGLPLENWSTFAITSHDVKGELGSYLDKETLDLIRLTIRFLENQKGDNR